MHQKTGRFMRFICLFILLCGFGRNLQATEIREANAGLIDLRTWTADDSLRIYGEWRFFPDQLLLPKDFHKAIEQPGPIFLKPGTRFPDKISYGTYLLQVESPCRNCRIHFALPQVYVAGKIFVFDDKPADAIQPLFELGAVSPASATEIPQLSTTLTPSFEVKESGRFYVLAQVSNFHFYWGGLWQPPMFFIKEPTFPAGEFLSSTFLLGLLLFCMVHSTSLFLRRREDAAGRELALFSIVMLVRAAVFAFAWRFALMHSLIMWELLWDFLYVSLACASFLFYRFTAACFLDEASARVQRVLGGMAALQIAIFLLIPVASAEHPVSILYGFTALCETCSLVIIVKALRRQKEGSLLALIGITGLLVSGITSLLWKWGHTNFSAMGVEIGTAIFMICQTQIVAKRAASAFRRTQQLSRELVDKDRARTLFFHNISHELRTPLHGILGFLNVILKGQYGPIGDRLRDQLLKIIHLTNNLKDQVNSILDLARSKRGELNLLVQKFPLNLISCRVQEIIDGLRLKHPRVQFNLHQHLNQEQIFAHDAEKILIILRNLLGNAFKFSRAEAMNQVTLRLEQDREGLCITVSDTGIGFEPEQIPLIFKEFSQLEAGARRSYEGAGLGLSIVKELLELMQGRIEVQSAPALGSTFKVWIPEALESSGKLAAAPDKVHAIVPKALAPVILHPQTLEHPERFLVLVIDDNALNCEVIQDLLRMDGYRVLVAHGGRSGIRLIEAEHPHLVLLDLMMPEVSGEDVIRHLKAEEGLRDIPVILITARATEEDRLSGLDLGADDYLAKPLVPDELRLRVRNILSRDDINRQLATQEYQDKMSQLGEVIGDLAREWQSLHAGIAPELMEADDRVARAARLLPLAAMQKNILVKHLQQRLSGRPVQGLLDILPQPDAKHPATRELQDLRLTLATMPLPVEQAREIWRSIGQLPEDSIGAVAEIVHLCQSYLQLVDAAKNSRELMESVLGFSRQEHVEHIVDLRQAVQRSFYLLRMRAARLGIDVRVEVEPIFIFTIEASVQQILLVLLTNAIEALADVPIEDRWIEISSHLDPVSRRAQILVSNGGPALDPAVKAQLFRRGFSTKAEQGRGIGLSVARRLSRQLQGDLHTASGGQHTQFILILPGGHQSVRAS